MSSGIRLLVVGLGTLLSVILAGCFSDGIEGVYEGEAVVTTASGPQTEDVRFEVSEYAYNEYEGKLIVEGTTSKDFEDGSTTTVIAPLSTLELSRSGEIFSTETELRVLETSGDSEDDSDESEDEFSSASDVAKTKETTTKYVANLTGDLTISDGILSGELCGTDRSRVRRESICVMLDDLELQEDEETSFTSDRKKGSKR